MKDLKNHYFVTIGLENDHVGIIVIPPIYKETVNFSDVISAALIREEIKFNTPLLIKNDCLTTLGIGCIMKETLFNDKGEEVIMDSFPVFDMALNGDPAIIYCILNSTELKEDKVLIGKNTYMPIKITEGVYDTSYFNK